MINFLFVTQAKVLEIEFSQESEIARFKGLQNFTFSSYRKKTWMVPTQAFCPFFF